MKEQKASDILLDLISTVILPVAAGVFFVEWAIDALSGYAVIFPLMGLLMFLLYYFSGNIYSGIIMLFAVIFGAIFAFVIESPPRTYTILLECAALIFFYVALESYRHYYASVKNAMAEEYDVLDMESTIKDSEIAENKRLSSAIASQIDNLKKIGSMIQGFESSLDEGEIIDKSRVIASQFVGNGEWNIIKNSKNDEFAQYVKSTGYPLVIDDLPRDNRFNAPHEGHMSVIAVPVEVDGKFWGIIKGTSAYARAFVDADLRLLSILSGIVSNVINNANLYKKVEGLAVTNSLTGLFTQSYFKERVCDETKRAKNGGFPVSVAILDIDYFKKVNDTYGHPAGDAVLRQISAILKKRFRETDLVSRYGGEEFGILMPHTKSKEAGFVLEQVRKTIENERFSISYNNLPYEIGVTVSVGIMSTENNPDIDCDELIRKADAALYDAKNSGRNKTVEYVHD